MIREIINFTNELIEDTPSITQLKLTPQPGLYVFIDINENGEWTNENLVKTKLPNLTKRNNFIHARLLQLHIISKTLLQVTSMLLLKKDLRNTFTMQSQFTALKRRRTRKQTCFLKNKRPSIIQSNFQALRIIWRELLQPYLN